MLGAYFGFFSLTLLKLPFVVAFLLASVGTLAVAIIVERIAYKPLRERKAPFLYFIISAMGASILLENIVIATIGPTFRTYPEVFSKVPITLGPLAIGRLDLIIFAISAVCLTLLILFIEKTKIGKAIQAASYNVKACALMGVNTDRVILTVFGLGGFLAGVAGVFFGMKYTVYPQIGNITTKSFIAAVFGGLGSLPGAVLGSVILGTIETFVAGYLSSQFRDLIAFVILIAVLVLRPTGIMGKVTEDKA